MWPPWRGVEYIIKGEGGDFPQVWAVVNLVFPSCPWFVLTLKVFQLCTNHFVLVLCKFVWVIKACHFFLVPSWSSSMPLYPSIVLRAKEHALIPCSSVVFNLGLTLSLKELGVCHWPPWTMAIALTCAPIVWAWGPHPGPTWSSLGPCTLVARPNGPCSLWIWATLR
jgi:hypothetical protein